jgi:hypothetical protein
MMGRSKDPRGECFDPVDHQVATDGVDEIEGVLGSGKLGIGDRLG